MADTNINAYLAELEEAKEEVTRAQGRVDGLRRQIVEVFGEDALPDSEPEDSEESPKPKRSRKPSAKKVDVKDESDEESPSDESGEDDK